MCQGVFQVLAGHLVTRVNPDSLLEVIGRLFEALLHQKRAAKVVVRPGVVRLDPNGFAQVADGLVHTPHCDENARGVVANLHRVRIQLERPFVVVNRLFVSRSHGQSIGKGGEDLQVGAPSRQGPLKVLHGLGGLSPLQMKETRVMGCPCKVGVDVQRGLEMTQRLVVFALPHADDAEVVPGVGEVGPDLCCRLEMREGLVEPAFVDERRGEIGVSHEIVFRRGKGVTE